MKNLNHLAVIMDGNSRWASNRNLPSKAGHKEGVKKARLAVEYALEKKIAYLTLFAFSTENWLREDGEVRDLIKVAKSEAENSKVAIRNQRRDANAMLKEFHNEKEISQDDLRRGEEIIQNLTDNYVTKIDLLLEKKEKDLLEI